MRLPKKKKVKEIRLDEMSLLINLNWEAALAKLTLPSTKSCVPMLTTVQPIALAELRQRV